MSALVRLLLCVRLMIERDARGIESSSPPPLRVFMFSFIVLS